MISDTTFAVSIPNLTLIHIELHYMQNISLIIQLVLINDECMTEIPARAICCVDQGAHSVFCAHHRPTMVPVAR